MTVFCLVATSPVLAGELTVSQLGDKGPGSLRHAIHQANQQPGEDIIRFASDDDLFQTPQTLSLSRPLPAITDTLTIDGYIPGRLWKASGVTLSAGGRFGIFHIPANSRVTLRHLTLTGGKADQGGAILSQGLTVIDSLLFTDNQAGNGGAIFQQGGQLTLINSTLLNNQARRQGGALFSTGGSLTLIHNTVTANQAPEGAGLYRQGPVHLANNILAHNQPGHDADCTDADTPDSHPNLIMRHNGCGDPAFTGDPGLGALGYYNGPTQSVPLRGDSPVINQADNSLSVDAQGAPLVWDQRGNGDPRFAAGIADMGAFEKQAVIDLEVDTLSDEDIRRCTRASQDCSLRGALALINASEDLNQLRFDPAVFSGESVLTLERPLPAVSKPVTLQLAPDQHVNVEGHGGLSLIPMTH